MQQAIKILLQVGSAVCLFASLVALLFNAIFSIYFILLAMFLVDLAREQ